jgi:ABC-type Fe3+-hydroxamate transport system substrate-binding protein
MERILKADPNYVLATIGNPRAFLSQLKKEGITVVEFQDPTSVLELPSSIEKIGKILGAGEKAREISLNIQSSITKLKNRQTAHEKFLFAIQFDPIYSISNKTWIGSLFQTAGYINIVGESSSSYPIIPMEYLVKNRPDVLFLGRNSRVSLQENLLQTKNQLEKIYGLKESLKIKIIYLPKDIFVRPGPRVLDAIQFLEGLPH